MNRERLDYRQPVRSLLFFILLIFLFLAPYTPLQNQTLLEWTTGVVHRWAATVGLSPSLPEAFAELCVVLGLLFLNLLIPTFIVRVLPQPSLNEDSSATERER